MTAFQPSRLIQTIKRACKRSWGAAGALLGRCWGPIVGETLRFSCFFPTYGCTGSFSADSWLQLATPCPASC